MKFLSGNRIEGFETITVSTGDDLKGYLYDRNFLIKWRSSSSDDTITETIEVEWGSIKTFNRICLLGHNLKEFNIQYWDSVAGAYADFSTAIDETSEADTNSFYSFDSVSTLKLKLSATKTQTANQQKEICEFLAYTEYFDIPDEHMPDSENLNLYYKEYEHELSDGGCLLVVESTKRKYRNLFNFTGLPETYRDQLFVLKDIRQSFWLIPFDDVIGDQYLCNLLNVQFNKVGFWVPSTGERCYGGSFEVKET